jgi:hypothetical protein
MLKGQFLRSVNQVDTFSFRFGCKKLCLFVFITILAVDANAEDPTEIPFTLTEWNNISVPALINGTDRVELMFHTANGSVDVIEESAKTLESIEWTLEGVAESWGGKSTSRLSENNSLQIGKLVWNNVTVHMDKNSGHSTDGKFGSFLFEEQVIELDFDEQLMTIHSELPDYAEEFEKMSLQMQRGLMFIHGIIHDGETQHRQAFLVHSGFSGAVLLDDGFVQSNQFVRELDTISESQLSDSFGNILKTRKVVLPKLQFGTTEFRNVPTGIFEGAIGKQKMSVVGMDVLKRFDILIDLKSEAIYFRNNQLVETPFSLKY